MSRMILHILAGFGVLTVLFIIVAVILALRTPIKAKRDELPPNYLRENTGMPEIQARIDELWNFSDPAGSEERFRSALDEADAPSARLELTTQLGRALGLQRRFDEAHAVLDAVDRDLSEQPDAPGLAPARVRAALERGRLLNTAGRPEDARPHFDAAWQLARDAGLDTLAIDAAHMIAIVAASDEALEWNRRALDVATASSDPRARRWQASLHNNLGWALHDRSEFEAALTHFQRALDCRMEQGQPEDIRIAKWCIGRCLRSLDRVDEALIVQQALHAEMIESGQPDGFVFEELAECLSQLGRVDDAQPHFARAYELLARDPWIAANEPERLERLRAQSGEPGTAPE